MDRKRAYFALAVLFAINTMNFYDRQIIAVVTEPIRKEWQLSYSQMALLGTAFTLIYAAVGLPLGRLTDKVSRTYILGIGVFAWSLLTALSGYARSYREIFALRLGVGVGEGPGLGVADADASWLLCPCLFAVGRTGTAVAPEG